MSSAATADLWAAIARDASRGVVALARRRCGRTPSANPSSRRSARNASRSGSRRSTRAISCTTARPRLFAPPDGDTALLLGDYLYAHGLVRIASFGEVDAVADLSELISLCSQLRAEAAPGDGPLWAATAALLGTRALDEARAALRLRGDAGPLDAAGRAAAGDDAVGRALVAHAERFR